MWICYIDEAGCTGVLPTATSIIQPVFVLAGVIVDQTHLQQLTLDFLELKKRFFPGLTLNGATPATRLEWVLPEIKGASLRSSILSAGRNQRRHTLGFLDRILDLLERYQIRLTGRLIVKGIGTPIDGTALYTSSIQSVCEVMHHWLTVVNDEGIIIADSRTQGQNATVSHSIFTQKFKWGGDDHARVVELPTFGHSQNHIGIQLADLVCSSLLYPMATFAYCTGHIANVHVQAAYGVLRARYGARLKKLQHRYRIHGNEWRGGIRVQDNLANRSGSLLFE